MASSRSLTVALIMFVTSAALLACSAFALDGFSSDEPAPGNDAAAGDGGSDGAGSDAGAGADAVAASGECAPTSGNLLVGQNETFEQGCALWTTDRVNLSASAVSHCGKQACRVCPYHADGSAFLSVTTPKKAGERYVFSIWMRREGETTPIVAVARIDMQENTALQFGSAPLMTEWGVGTATLDVPEGLEAEDFRLGVSPRGWTTSGECFLIDDAALVRVKDAGL